MGFLDRFFGGSKYPELDPSSETAHRLEEFGDPIKHLAQDIHDRLEVVMGGDGVFVFVGKPPKQFGVMWIENGEVKNFKQLVEEEHLDSKKLNTLIDRMKSAYTRHIDEERFSMKMADRELVIHPSDQFEHEMEQIISSATH